MASVVMSILILLISTSVMYGEKMVRALPHPRPILTIKSDDGDTIDCINIYEQPAFNHPLLKNHKIQMKPTNYQPMNDSPTLQQTWHKSGSCPGGTIPILRTYTTDEDVNVPGFFKPKSPANGRQEDVSTYVSSRRPYFGTEALLYVSDPPIVAEPNEYSITYIAIGSQGDGSQARQKEQEDQYKQFKDMIAAGWAVYPSLFYDHQPRTFVFFTNDNEKNGCYNIQCAFVQTNEQFALGGVIQPSPDTGALRTHIFRDSQQFHWWVSFENEPVGYWPMEVFSNFSAGDVAQWGGAVFNSFPNGFHTNTTMGNGQFPSTYNIEAIGDIRVVTSDGSQGVVEPEGIHVTVPNCYGYNYERKLGQPGHGFYMGYGGPGGPNCDK